MATTKQLLNNLREAEEEAERTLAVAREAIIKEIEQRLADGGVTPYAFTAATGITRGNFYNLLSRRNWNKVIALKALDFLSTPIRDYEAKVAATPVNAFEVGQ